MATPAISAATRGPPTSRMIVAAGSHVCLDRLMRVVISGMMSCASVFVKTSFTSAVVCMISVLILIRKAECAKLSEHTATIFVSFALTTDYVLRSFQVTRRDEPFPRTGNGAGWWGGAAKVRRGWAC